MSNTIITLAIAATAGGLGASQDMGTAKLAELRKFDLRAGLAQGDIVLILGSSDNTTFNPVLLPDPATGAAVPLQLSSGRASAEINDRSRYYRTQRVQVGSGSSLAACGLQVGDDTTGSVSSVIALAVDTTAGVFGGIQDLGTDKAPEWRKFDAHAGLAQGDIVTIYSSSDGTTFNPVLLPDPATGAAVPLELSSGRASATISDRSRYYRTLRRQKGTGSTLTEVGLEVSTEQSVVVSDGVNTDIGGSDPNAFVEIDGAGTGGIQLVARTGSNVDIQSLLGDIFLTSGRGGKGVKLLPGGASAGDTTPLQFRELAANGSNFVGFKAPDSIAANVTWVLPNADATIAGQRLSSDAAGNLSWMGRVSVRAHNTNAQSIGDGAAAAIVTTWVEDSDLANAFNNTTGIFTCPAAGAYVISAELEYAAIASIVAGEFTVQIAKNGTLVASGVEIVQVAAANVKRNPKVTCIIELGSSDTIDIRASQNSGSGANLLTNVATRNVLSIIGPL